MYYRFAAGNFIEADSFDEAKEIAMILLKHEPEELDRWHKCSCVGLGHSFSCPEANHNKGIVSF